MNKITSLLIICMHFTKCFGQCHTDKHYKFYHTLILNEKGNIQKVFDGILEKYGDIDNILEGLLHKLNKTVSRADSGLNQLEDHNQDIKENNKNSNAKLPSLLQTLEAVDKELKLINFNDSWAKEKEVAQKAANRTSPWPASELDILEQDNELGKWKKFLKELDGQNYLQDITNLPHTVSDELNLLEKLIAEAPATNCFDQFHNDLKLLFVELTNLFDLDNFIQNLEDMKAKALQNRADADNIHSKTNQFLEREKQFEDIFRLTNETLALAEEIDNLREIINRLSGQNSEIINDRLKKILEEHEAEIAGLNDKYNIKEGQLLINKLKTTKREIENTNMANVEKDIDNYIQDINYYTCILEACDSSAKNISSCKREKSIL